MNLQAITTVIGLIPTIIAVIKAIEEAIPGAGVGEQKLAAVRGILEIADDSVKNMWPQIEGTITALVKLFNGTIWKKG